MSHFTEGHLQIMNTLRNFGLFVALCSLLSGTLLNADAFDDDLSSYKVPVTAGENLAACCDKPSIDPNPTPPIEIGSCGGIWFPEDPVLFRPFVADPHAINFSGGWRLNDQAFVKNVIDVSLGNTMGIYRWLDVWGGQLQIEVEGAVWVCFDPLHNSSPLLNADYYGGIPITYSVGPWAFRLRGYHISSHIGDEFLLNHPEFDRRNPSAEYLDFYASYYPTDDIRLYGGIGAVVSQDKSYPFGRFYAETGLELHLSQLGFINDRQQLFGRPFFSMHFKFQTKQEKHINQTYVLGYEWGKLCGLQRVFRLFLEYHDGYSYEGQFSRSPTNYLSLRASYGF